MAEVEATRETNSEAKTWGMLTHLSALATFIIPFGNLIGPLIVWLIKKNEHSFVDEQGKESLNFQITMTIAGFVLVPLAVVASFLVRPLICLVPVVGIVAIAWLVLVIVAAVKSSSGEHYRYPIALRLIK